MWVNSSFVCWGASGHARVLQNILVEQGAQWLAFIDRGGASDAYLGRPLFSNLDAFAAWRSVHADNVKLSGVIAIGRQGPDRLDALLRLQTLGIDMPVIVARQASVSPDASLGAGCQVLPFGVVAAGARLGRACIVNHGAIVDHECVVCDSAHLAPRSILCGCVTVGCDVFVGAGAVVLPRVHIGDGAMIGAGAIVTHDVSAGVTVMGNPARPNSETL